VAELAVGSDSHARTHDIRILVISARSIVAGI
jgi:hypothetical protein